MSDPKTINEAMLLLAGQIRKDKPYLFVIDEAIDKAVDGIVELQVRVYRGRVTDIVVAKSQRFTFSEKK